MKHTLSAKMAATLAFCCLTSLALLPTAAEASAYSDRERTPAGETWEKIDAAIEAVGDYGATQREQAVENAEEALNAADRQIEKVEKRLRERWGSLSTDAKQSYSKALHDLRQARNRLSEHYGAMQQASAGAWSEVQEAFSNAGRDLEEAWIKLSDDGAPGSETPPKPKPEPSQQ